MFRFEDNLNETLCKENPNALVVFGDNLIGKGKLGQAIIRDEPNAFGVPTKRLPSMNAGSFFSDAKDEKEIIAEKLLFLIKEHEKGKLIILPTQPIGSGLASLKTNSPQIAKMVDAFYHYAKASVSFEENKMNLTIFWASKMKYSDERLSSKYGVSIVDNKNMSANISGLKENIANFLTSSDYGMSYEYMIKEFPQLKNEDNNENSEKSTSKIRRER